MRLATRRLFCTSTRIERWPLTKTIATIGPASEDPETIQALINEEMKIMRINFSHATYVSSFRVSFPDEIIKTNVQVRRSR